MRHRNTHAVFDYFNRLRGDRTAPLRSEIEPSAIKSALPDLFILEFEEEGALRFRLAGTRVCLILGREARNCEFPSFWDDCFAHRMALTAQTVIASQRPALADVTAIAEGEWDIPAEMLMLPLYSRPGRCDRILGSLVALDNSQVMTARDRRLEMEACRFLSASEPLPPSLTGTAPAPIAAPPVASSARMESAAEELRLLAARMTPFRVIDGGRQD